MMNREKALLKLIPFFGGNSYNYVSISLSLSLSLPVCIYFLRNQSLIY